MGLSGMPLYLWSGKRRSQTGDSSRYPFRGTPRHVALPWVQNPQGKKRCFQTAGELIVSDRIPHEESSVMRDSTDIFPDMVWTLFFFQVRSRFSFHQKNRIVVPFLLSEYNTVLWIAMDIWNKEIHSAERYWSNSCAWPIHVESRIQRHKEERKRYPVNPRPSWELSLCSSDL